MLVSLANRQPARVSSSPVCVPRRASRLLPFAAWLDQSNSENKKCWGMPGSLLPEATGVVPLLKVSEYCASTLDAASVLRQ